MKRRIPIGLIGMLGLLQSSLVSAIQSVDFSIPATSAVFSDSTCSELAYVSFSANNIQTGLTGDNGVPGSLDVYWILLEDPNGTPIAAVQRSTFSGFNKVDSTGLLYPPTGTNPLTGDYELSLVDVTGTDAFIAFTPEELQQRVADDLAYERPFPAQFTLAEIAALYQDGGQFFVCDSIGYGGNEPEPPNTPPVINLTFDEVSVNEGETASATLQISDAEGDPLTVAASPGNISSIGANDWLWTYPTTDGPAQSEQVLITASDGEDSAARSFNLTVYNVAPAVDAGGDLAVEFGLTVDILATFSDPGAADTHTASVDWGDGTSGPARVDSVARNASASHDYGATGAYAVQICVQDNDGGEGCDEILLEVAGIDVAFDLKPDDPRNRVNLKAKQVQAAVYGSDRLDVARFDLDTVRVSGASIATRGNGDFRADYLDLDDDGWLDLQFTFLLSDTTLDYLSRSVDFNAWTIEGDPLAGSDFVVFVGHNDRQYIEFDGAIVIVLKNSPYRGAYDYLIPEDDFNMFFDAGTYGVPDDGTPLIIHGNNRRNFIASGFGDDVIIGYNGDDTIYGCAGFDQIFGDNGRDSIYGDCGDEGIYPDVLYGGNGNDRLIGDGENSSSGEYRKGSGDDVIYGENGDDYIVGDTEIGEGIGNDFIEGGEGRDQIWGDNAIRGECTGNDTIWQNGLANTPDGEPDLIRTGFGDNTVYASAEDGDDVSEVGPVITMVTCTDGGD